MSAGSESMVASITAAILASVGITPAHAAPLEFDDDAEFDRELQMRISNGFTTQIWAYAGEVWKETADILALHEDECVRITIANDTPTVRVVSVGPGRVLRIRPGETANVDLAVTSLLPFSIDVVGVPAFTRPVTVRASNCARTAIV
ncbi:MAG TPA: hypothetical protein VFV70_09875 [Hyphomonadaceae bacterium]|nr:hypothetical protein [Hyphomonadaceae bacterium]